MALPLPFSGSTVVALRKRARSPVNWKPLRMVWSAVARQVASACVPIARLPR